MKNPAIRRPVPGLGLSPGICPPAVPLRSTAPRGSAALHPALYSAAPFGRSAAPEARWSRARSEAQRNSGECVANNIPNPWQGVTENGVLEVALIKRQTMRPQDHLEFFEKRNASMMFFLPLDIAPDLRNLRLAHGERAVSFLPPKRPTFLERSRNPRGRIRFDFADHLRHRLVLPHSRQDVNVIRGSVHTQRDSAFAANRPAEIFMNPRAHGYRQPRFASLRRKHDVVQKIAMGGTHSERPLRRPSSGARLSCDDTPGVALRSTPSCSSAALHCRLYSAAPPALFSLRPRAQRRRRDGSNAFIPPPPPGALILRTRGSAWRSQVDGPVQRRRRDRLKRRVERSETRGNNRLRIVKPLIRGAGERGGISLPSN